MEKTSKELLKEFVNSQHFTSTTDNYEQYEGTVQRRASDGNGGGA